VAHYIISSQHFSLHFQIQKTCLKEVNFLEFIANHIPMWMMLCVDTWLFLLFDGLQMCSFKDMLNQALLNLLTG
jgi:hypothetical protein